MTTKSCSIGGCGKPHYGQGYCKTHGQRWRRHGDPLVVLPPGPPVMIGPDHPQWTGDDVGYRAAHRRVAKLEGPASAHPCLAGCGGRAYDWAYDCLDPEEKTDPKTGLPYSLDPEHYVPLCRPCHDWFDRRSS
jgi:hypothetical protein